MSASPAYEALKAQIIEIQRDFVVGFGKWAGIDNVENLIDQYMKL